VVRTSFRKGVRDAQKAAGAARQQDVKSQYGNEDIQEQHPVAFTHSFTTKEEANAVTSLLVESFSRRKDREAQHVSGEHVSGCHISCFTNMRMPFRTGYSRVKASFAAQVMWMF
jgi:hypothetical protein